MSEYQWSAVNENSSAFSSSASVSTAQDRSPDDEQRSRRPAHVNGGPQLPSPLRRGQGVVEARDDGVSGPADGNDAQDSCYDEDHAPGEADIGLEQPFVAVEVGAAGPDHGQPDGYHADGDRDADQSPRGLQVLR